MSLLFFWFSFYSDPPKVDIFFTMHGHTLQMCVWYVFVVVNHGYINHISEQDSTWSPPNTSTMNHWAYGMLYSNSEHKCSTLATLLLFQGDGKIRTETSLVPSRYSTNWAILAWILLLLILVFVETSKQMNSFKNDTQRNWKFRKLMFLISKLEHFIKQKL